MPRLVPQSPASRELHLFGDVGDPAYRDVNPVDGIDDERWAVLMQLAVRFAPFLVQNTSNFPVNCDVYIENRESFPLVVDTWEISGSDPGLHASAEVNISALGIRACTDTPDYTRLSLNPDATLDPVLEDCKMQALLDRFAPGGSGESSARASFVQQSPEMFNVFYFNFPGDGAGTWQQAYRPEYEKTDEDRRRYFPHSYVHPFILEVVDVDGNSVGYELLLQYWFFYPTNDSGMNHEGDWEHINVAIAPRNQVSGALRADEIQAIIRGTMRADDSGNPLVIKRVDYYFHDLVMQLDFSSPNVYLPREAWKAQVETLPRSRFNETDLWRDTRYLAYADDAETVINTHPFGYIGSDNKGANQALSAPGGKNRDSHATYPFPGRYQDVGPGGTTDQVALHVDHREYLRRLSAGRVSTGPAFERGKVLGLADPDRLRIVPDWERVVDLVRTDAAARRNWSWMLLPIHWGYPATSSPFSGVLAHYNMGNVAPVGPSFSTGWNASGATSSFSAYEPHTIPSVFPLGFQDSFRNDLGFLNLTFPLLFNLPPLDFLTRIVTYPVRLAFGHRDPVYYPKVGIPFRFVGISSGASTQFFDQDFATLALNPQQFDPFIGSLVTHLAVSGLDSTTTVTGTQATVDEAVSPFLQMTFYFGGRFATENTVRNSRATIRYDAQFSNIASYSYRADLNLWEYIGSLRYSLSTSRYQPFIKGGYGWAWYRVENAHVDGQDFAPVDSDWFEPDSILPNVWHLGLGFEYIPAKRIGTLFNGLDLAFRLEYVWFTQQSGLDLSSVSLDRLGFVFNTLGDVPTSERLDRHDLFLGVTLSF